MHLYSEEEAVIADKDVKELIDEANRLLRECGDREFSEEEEKEYDAEFGYYFPDDED